jgi:uncharacterized protein
VDDTIHFLARYREEPDHNPNRQEAIVSTYSHCAIPTLQAALISGLGLSVFAFSTFTPTQRFGWLMLCILLAGVVSELILLPALLASPLGKVFSLSPQRSYTGAVLVKTLFKKSKDIPLSSTASEKNRQDSTNQEAA